MHEEVEGFLGVGYEGVDDGSLEIVALPLLHSSGQPAQSAQEVEQFAGVGCLFLDK